MDSEIELVPTGPPRTLKWTFWVTVVWSALSLLAVLALFGERPYLRKTLVTSNNKAKKPIANYTGRVLDDAVQKSLVIGLVVTLLVVVILILLAQLAWRGRPWARWALIAMATVPGVFFGIGVVGQLAFGTLQSSPGLHKLLTIMAGFASLLVIVLLVDSGSRAYFTAIRDTKRGTLPPVPDAGGGTRARRGTRSSGTGPAGATTGTSTGWAPRSGGLGALFRKSMTPASTATNPVTDAAPEGSPSVLADPVDAASSDRPAGAPARRTSATRPGSVKAKGSGTRPGRSKSRQQ